MGLTEMHICSFSTDNPIAHMHQINHAGYGFWTPGPV